MSNDYNKLIKKLYNNKKITVVIDMQNAFKLKPIPSYKPNINYNGK